jgi:hypothetical protein
MGIVVVVGRGWRAIARECNTNVRVEPRAPHKDQVLAQLVDPEVLRIVYSAFFACLLVEQKLESLAKALASVQILELIGEQGRIDAGGQTSKTADSRWSG